VGAGRGGATPARRGRDKNTRRGGTAGAPSTSGQAKVPNHGLLGTGAGVVGNERGKKVVERWWVEDFALPDPSSTASWIGQIPPSRGTGHRTSERDWSGASRPGGRRKNGVRKVKAGGAHRLYITQRRTGHGWKRGGGGRGHKPRDRGTGRRCAGDLDSHGAGERLGAFGVMFVTVYPSPWGPRGGTPPRCIGSLSEAMRGKQ